MGSLDIISLISIDNNLYNKLKKVINTDDSNYSYWLNGRIDVKPENFLVRLLEIDDNSLRCKILQIINYQKLKFISLKITDLLYFIEYHKNHSNYRWDQFLNLDKLLKIFIDNYANMAAPIGFMIGKIEGSIYNQKDSELFKNLERQSYNLQNLIDYFDTLEKKTKTDFITN